MPLYEIELPDTTMEVDSPDELSEDQLATLVRENYQPSRPLTKDEQKMLPSGVVFQMEDGETYAAVKGGRVPIKGVLGAAVNFEEWVEAQNVGDEDKQFIKKVYEDTANDYLDGKIDTSEFARRIATGFSDSEVGQLWRMYSLGKPGGDPEELKGILTQPEKKVVDIQNEILFRRGQLPEGAKRNPTYSDETLDEETLLKLLANAREDAAEFATTDEYKKFREQKDDAIQKQQRKLVEGMIQEAGLKASESTLPVGEGIAGKAADFGQEVLGAAVSPLSVLPAFGGPVSGKTIASRFAQRFGLGAIENMAGEAVAQPIIASGRAVTSDEGSFLQSVVEVLGAGAFGGTLKNISDPLASRLGRKLSKQEARVIKAMDSRPAEEVAQVLDEVVQAAEPEVQGVAPTPLLDRLEIALRRSESGTERRLVGERERKAKAEIREEEALETAAQTKQLNDTVVKQMGGLTSDALSDLKAKRNQVVLKDVVDKLDIKGARKELILSDFPQRGEKMELGPEFGVPSERERAITRQLDEDELLRRSPLGGELLRTELSALESAQRPTEPVLGGELLQRRNAIIEQLDEAQNLRQSQRGRDLLAEDLRKQAAGEELGDAPADIQFAQKAFDFIEQKRRPAGAGWAKNPKGGYIDLAGIQTAAMEMLKSGVNSFRAFSAEVARRFGKAFSPDSIRTAWLRARDAFFDSTFVRGARAAVTTSLEPVEYLRRKAQILRGSQEDPVVPFTLTDQRVRGIVNDDTKVYIGEKFSRKARLASKRTGADVGSVEEDAKRFAYARHAIDYNADKGDGAAGITDEVAGRIMEEVRAQPWAAESMSMADDLVEFNREGLRNRLMGDVIDQETFDTLTTKYPYYVPLQRDFSLDAAQRAYAIGDITKAQLDELVIRAEEMGDLDPRDMLIGSPRGTVINSALYRGKGSQLPAGDILENSVKSHAAGVQRAQANQALQAFVRTLDENDTTIAGSVEVVNPPIVGTRTIQDANGNDIKVPRYQEIPDNAIQFFVNGKRKWLKFDKRSPEAMKVKEAITGANIKQLGAVRRLMKMHNNILSGLYTSWNTGFAPVNKVRDQLESSMNLVDAIGYGAAVNMQKYLGRDMASIAAYHGWDINKIPILGKAAGETLASPAMVRQYREFVRSGGSVGGLGTKTAQDLKNLIKGFENVQKNGKISAAQKTKIMAEKITEMVEKYNRIFEDSTRFSAYLAAKEAGKTQDEAAFLARNISFDPYRQGTYGMNLGAYKIFTNAIIQSSTRVAKTMTNPKAASAIIGSMVGMSIFQQQWNDSVYPNWYNEIDSFARDNGMTFVYDLREDGGPKYFTIPLPYSWVPIKIMADGAAMSMNGKDIDKAEFSKRAALEVVSGFTPFDAGIGASALFPTVAQPWAEIWKNESFFGRIRPQDALENRGLRASSQAPNMFTSQLATPQGQFALRLAEHANRVGLPLSGADILHLYKTYTGGLGRDASKFVDTVQTLMDPDTDLSITDIPAVGTIAGRFMRETPIDVAQARSISEDPQLVKDARKAITDAAYENNLMRSGVQEYLKLEPEQQGEWLNQQFLDGMFIDNETGTVNERLVEKFKRSLGNTQIRREYDSISKTLTKFPDNERRASAVSDLFNRQIEEYGQEQGYVRIGELIDIMRKDGVWTSGMQEEVRKKFGQSQAEK